jgi:hypothetical protein
MIIHDEEPVEAKLQPKFRMSRAKHALSLVEGMQRPQRKLVCHFDQREKSFFRSSQFARDVEELRTVTKGIFDQEAET